MLNQLKNVNLFIFGVLSSMQQFTKYNKPNDLIITLLFLYFFRIPHILGCWIAAADVRLRRSWGRPTAWRRVWTSAGGLGCVAAKHAGQPAPAGRQRKPTNQHQGGEIEIFLGMLLRFFFFLYFHLRMLVFHIDYYLDLRPP